MRTRGGRVASCGSGLNVDLIRCATRTSSRIIGMREAVLGTQWTADVVGAGEVRYGGRSGSGFFFFFLRQHQVVYTRAIPKKHRSIVIGRTQL